MKTSYFVAAGTAAYISQDGTDDFQLFKAAKTLQFEDPVETTEQEMVFVRDSWRIRVKRKDVVVKQFGD